MSDQFKYKNVEKTYEINKNQYEYIEEEDFLLDRSQSTFLDDEMEEINAEQLTELNDRVETHMPVEVSPSMKIQIPLTNNLAVKKSQEQTLEFEAKYLEGKIKEETTEDTDYELKMSLFEDRMKLLYNDQKSFSKDSKEMKNIKTQMSLIDHFLNSEATKENYTELKNAYDNAMVAADNYLKTKNPWTAEGKRRKARVKEIKETLDMMNETIQLANEWIGNDAFGEEENLSRFTVKDLLTGKNLWKENISKENDELTDELYDIKNGITYGDELSESVEASELKSKEELADNSWYHELKEEMDKFFDMFNSQIDMEYAMSCQKNIVKRLEKYRGAINENDLKTAEEKYRYAKIRDLVDYMDKYSFLWDTTSGDFGLLISYGQATGEFKQGKNLMDVFRKLAKKIGTGAKAAEKLEKVKNIMSTSDPRYVNLKLVIMDNYDDIKQDNITSTIDIKRNKDWAGSIDSTVNEINGYKDSFGSLIDQNKIDALSNLGNYERMKKDCETLLKAEEQGKCTLQEEQKQAINTYLNNYGNVREYYIQYCDIVMSPEFETLLKKGMYLGDDTDFSPSMDYEVLKYVAARAETDVEKDLAGQWQTLQRTWQKVSYKNNDDNFVEKTKERLFDVSEEEEALTEREQFVSDYNKQKYFWSVSGGWFNNKLDETLPKGVSRTAERSTKSLFANLSLYKRLTGEETLEKYKYMAIQAKSLEGEELQKKVDTMEDFMKEVISWDLSEFSCKDENGGIDISQMSYDFVDKYSKMQILSDIDELANEYENMFLAKDRKVKFSLSEDDFLKFDAIKKTLQDVFSFYKGVTTQRQLPASETDWGKNILSMSYAEAISQMGKKAENKEQEAFLQNLSGIVFHKAKDGLLKDFGEGGDCQAVYDKYSEGYMEARRNKWKEKASAN